MLTGHNGLITKTIQAKEETEIASEKEQIQLSYTELQMSDLNKSVEASALYQQLNNKKVEVKTVLGNDILTVIMKNKHIYEIDNGNINFMGTQIIYTDDEPIMENYTKLDWRKPEYYSKITIVETKPYILNFDNAIEIWDVSEKQNKSVLAYLLDDENGGYKLYICANGNIKVNTNASYYFHGFTNLQYANLTYFDTSNVQNMFQMFYGCSSLTSIDLSSFDTKNVTNMHQMFSNCNSLENINLSNFNTSNVTTMHGMFDHCSNLTYIDLSNFDTSKVTSMAYMFNNCTNLVDIDLSNFNTENLKSCACMFYFCSNLKTVDLSGFYTKNLNNTGWMFRTCLNLETIYVSAFDETIQKGWTNAAITASDTMFLDCRKIVGGNGTIYDSNYVDASYACIDTELTKGYFKEK